MCTKWWTDDDYRLVPHRWISSVNLQQNEELLTDIFNQEKETFSSEMDTAEWKLNPFFKSSGCETSADFIYMMENQQHRIRSDSDHV